MKPMFQLALGLLLASMLHGSVQGATINSSRQNLNGQECTNLGGVIKETTKATCASGKLCSRTGQDGKIYRVCLEKNAAIKNVAKPGFSNRPVKPGGGNAPIVGKVKKAGVVTGVPLTIEECEGLGGVVYPKSTECAWLPACATTDRFGVIRVVCINKVSR